MPATSWAPAYDQTDPSGADRVVAARVNTDTVEQVMRNPYIPFAINPMAQWLLDEVDFVMPPMPRTVWPPDQGRGHPRTH